MVFMRSTKCHADDDDHHDDRNHLVFATVVLVGNKKQNYRLKKQQQQQQFKLSFNWRLNHPNVRFELNNTDTE